VNKKPGVKILKKYKGSLNQINNKEITFN